MQYIIIKCFFQSTKGLEANQFYRKCEVGFSPCSYEEALILRRRLTDYQGSIYKIVPLSEWEAEQ